jgi:nucleotide-binding universal stress UspA family protein
MKIMVAYDIVEPSQKILEIASEYAEAFNASVCIVSCLAVGEAVRSYWEAKAESDLSSAGKIIEAKGAACETFSIFSANTPGECLLEFAAHNHVEQIIIGIRAKSKVHKIVFGSNAQYIILKASCPVVSVPLS